MCEGLVETGLRSEDSIVGTAKLAMVIMTIKSIKSVQSRLAGAQTEVADF